LTLTFCFFSKKKTIIYRLERNCVKKTIATEGEWGAIFFAAEYLKEAV
jgi:hypothetical protein